MNIGPLLWNCEENGPGGRLEGDLDDDAACKSRMRQKSDSAGGFKLELMAEEVILLLKATGFKTEDQKNYAGDSGYMMDPKSMLQNIYRLTHWKVKK